MCKESNIGLVNSVFNLPDVLCGIRITEEL